MVKRIRQVVLGGAAVIALAPFLHADVIYQDNFSGASGTALGGNVLPVDSGLDGGTAGATWQANTTTASNPDAIWQYSGSNSASILSPNGTGARDTNLIADALLPFTPQAGYVYDLEATITVPSGGTDNGHWLGLAFENFENGGTGGGAAALSNDGATGLAIVRDAVSSGASLNIFQGAAGGTGGQANYNIPGGVGTPVTVDVLLNTLGGLSDETIDWEINGVSVGAPVTLSGNPAINYVAFGDDTAPSGTVTNFSLTATVPEPASLGLLVTTGGVFGLRRRRGAARC